MEKALEMKNNAMLGLLLLVRLFYSETKSGSQSYDRELQRELK
jgi:hypothetical protein